MALMTSKKCRQVRRASAELALNGVSCRICLISTSSQINRLYYLFFFMKFAFSDHLVYKVYV